MAVQKHKVTRSRRGMRRSHDALDTLMPLATDKETGELHRRHHLTADGYYRGRQVIAKKPDVVEEDSEQSQES